MYNTYMYEQVIKILACVYFVEIFWSVKFIFDILNNSQIQYLIFVYY